MDLAIPHYRRALEVSPAYLEAHHDLSDALYSQGRALSLATREDEQPLAAGLRAKIALYEARAASQKTQ